VDDRLDAATAPTERERRAVAVGERAPQAAAVGGREVDLEAEDQGR
jgi:hypothetical protein